MLEIIISKFKIIVANFGYYEHETTFHCKRLPLGQDFMSFHSYFD